MFLDTVFFVCMLNADSIFYFQNFVTWTWLLTYIHIYIYIPWIHNCVIKTVGCGSSYNTQNIQIYNIKYYKNFTKTVL